MPLAALKTYEYNLYMRFLISCCLSFLLLLNSSPALFAQVLAAPQNNTELRQISVSELINNFYQTKAKNALRDAHTYAARYNAVAFYSYPRVFWEDKINFAPYNKTGALFTQNLGDTYDYLKEQQKPDAVAAAQAAAAYIINNPRRVNVAKNIPMPQAGDIWHNAFYLASFHIQLGDFASKVSSENKTYAQYKKYIANGDNFMAAPYKNYDFTIAKSRYNPAVFLQRRADIEAFVKEYTTVANTFIRRALAPLQTDNIKGADVKAYLAANLQADALPKGVNRAQLINTLSAEIPAPQYFYERAAQINPSFKKQLTAAHTVLVNTRQARWADVGDMFSLFEYISPGTLIERLSKYGKIPARETVIEEIASALAADALNKSLAQIANDLFEFEKPFYYSYSSLGASQEEIVKNWRAAATSAFFSDKMIAKIAADNIIQSGKRAYQDKLLSASLLQRNIQENLKFYDKAIPIAADFAAGDAAFILAAPLFKNARLMVNSLKNSLKFDGDAFKALKGFEIKTAKQIRNSTEVWEDIAAIKRVESTGNLEHAVWQLKTADGKTAGYFKLGTHSEVMRTREIDNIVKKYGMREKYNLLEIEYPQVLASNIEVLPQPVKKNVLADFRRIKDRVRDVETRTAKPFITSAVDTRGFTARRLQINAGEDPLTLLGNKQISNAEWKQIKGFFRELNENGFNHSDLWNNMHIRRMPDGKLKITMIDFESVLWGAGDRASCVSDVLMLDHVEGMLDSHKLREVISFGF